MARKLVPQPVMVACGHEGGAGSEGWWWKQVSLGAAGVEMVDLAPQNSPDAHLHCNTSMYSFLSHLFKTKKLDQLSHHDIK